MFSKPNLRSTLVLFVLSVLATNFDNVRLATARLIYLSQISTVCNITTRDDFADISDQEAERLLRGIPLKFSDIVLSAHNPEDRSLRSACLTNQLAKSKDYPVKVDGYYQSGVLVNPLPVIGELLWIGLLLAAALAIIRFILFRVFSTSGVLGRFTVLMTGIGITVQIAMFDGPLHVAVRGLAIYQSVFTTAICLFLFGVLLLMGRWVWHGFRKEANP